MTPRRLDRSSRREQLLETVLELAAGRDVTEVSVEDIAAHAGVSEGLLYHYFPTKEALLVAAVQRAADALIASVGAAAEGSPREALTAGLRAYLDHVQADPTGWSALLQARSGALAEIGATVEAHARGVMLALLGVQQPSPVLEVVLDGWAALERDVCVTWLRHPETPRHAIEDLLMTTFLAALDAASRHDGQSRTVLDRLS